MYINIGKSYPSKLTLNLVMKDKKPVNAITFVPLLALIIFGSVLFSKFAVIDQLDSITTAQSLENAAEQRLEEIMKSTTDYNTVLAEYNKYALISGFEATERSYVDRMDLLKMIKTNFINRVTVNSFSFSANTLSVKIQSINLTDLSALLQTLEALPMVDSVTISNAGATDNTAAAVTMTLTLVKVTATE